MLGTTADLVAITGVRAPLAAVAARIAAWRRAQPGVEHKYGLLAVGPSGQMRLELDTEPDLDAVAELLSQVYEEGSS